MSKQAPTKKSQMNAVAPKKAKNNGHISGIDNATYTNLMVNQLADASYIHLMENDDKQKLIDSILLALVHIEPKDAIEGQLAAQMVACHNMMMDCMRRAMLKGQTHEGRQENLKYTVKLSRTYAQLVDTLNRHRGKGMQKIIVERVNVEQGGQAIVGAITHTGGGVKEKIKEQPHA